MFQTVLMTQGVKLVTTLIGNAKIVVAKARWITQDKDESVSLALLS
jgi:hypothetical protein